MDAYGKIREDIITVGKLLYDKNLIVGTDGNISVKLDKDHIMITGSGFCKGMMKPENLTIVNAKGEILEGPKPARDIRMHLAVYHTCRQARAVVHAHPPVTSGFAISRYDFSKITFPEVLFTLHGIACTDYAVPISIDVARGVRKCMKNNPESRAIVLANHGALTFSEDLFDAFYRMETLELYTKATLVSHIIGNPYYLNEQETDTLYQLLGGKNPDEIIPPDENGW